MLVEENCSIKGFVNQQCWPVLVVWLLLSSLRLSCLFVIVVVFVFFFFYKSSTSFQAKKAFVIIYYIFVLLHFLCYVLVRLEGLMVLCFVRWYSFWFYNMYLQVTFFLFLKSYYLKWPGCFNGCRCGDECKVQVYPPLDSTDWERVDQLNLLLLINMRFFYKRHKMYIINIYIYIYIYIYMLMVKYKYISSTRRAESQVHY